MISLVIIYLVGAFTLWDFSWVYDLPTYDVLLRLIILLSWVLLSCIEFMVWAEYWDI